MKVIKGADIIPPEMVMFLEGLTSLDEVKSFLKRRYPNYHIRKGDIRVSVSLKTNIRKKLILITIEKSAKLREDNF